jgi:hypothetical protein
MGRIIALCSLALLACSVWASAGTLVWAAEQERGTPGEEKKFKSRALEAGAELMQDMEPVEALNMYLDGFHFYADDAGHQMEAHHFCSQIGEEMHQCVIYDGNETSSRLIGVEYIISESLYGQLPKEEKRLWHSHHYEVKSGQLVAPGVPEFAEHELMEKLVTTYGKTWHTWDSHKHKLPVGIPALMMGFTEDGQINEGMLKERDDRLDVSTREKREGREDIPMPEVDPDANSWQSGKTHQLDLKQKKFNGFDGKQTGSQKAG